MGRRNRTATGLLLLCCHTFHSLTHHVISIVCADPIICMVWYAALRCLPTRRHRLGVSPKHWGFRSQIYSVKAVRLGCAHRRHERDRKIFS